MKVTTAIVDFLRQVFNPAPAPIAREMKRRADEIVRSAEEYGRHADVLADLVRNVRHFPRVPARVKKTRTERR